MVDVQDEWNDGERGIEDGLTVDDRDGVRDIILDSAWCLAVPHEIVAVSNVASRRKPYGPQRAKRHV